MEKQLCGCFCRFTGLLSMGTLDFFWNLDWENLGT